MFITGSGTDVGKTLITGRLSRAIQRLGRGVTTQKWVQTGANSLTSDLEIHRFFIGSQPELPLSLRLPYCFEVPCAPHLAAKLEAEQISVSRLRESYLSLSQHFDSVLVEGSGGVLVPLLLGDSVQNTVFICDVAIALGLKIVLVVSNQVGALHSALSAVDALLHRGGDLACVILNQVCKDVAEMVLCDNESSLKQVLACPVFRVDYLEALMTSSVVVGDSNDIVFTEIAAALGFNDH